MAACCAALLVGGYRAPPRSRTAAPARVYRTALPPRTQVTPHHYIGAWPSEEALVPAVHPAVLDVTCELPLQLDPPAYLALPVWDTHGGSEGGEGGGWGAWSC